MDAKQSADALRACRTIIETSQRPLDEVDEYLNALSKGSGWSQTEIQDLQSRVIQGILEQWRGPKGQ